ncbi:MAG: hypothetical protein HQL93_09710 [Magnetococcales bacterium]|nr:hypothetical protein [Magnetococcales bacterium]
MNAGEHLAELNAAGINIVWDDDGVGMSLIGDVSDEEADKIRENKPAIVAWMASERPLTDAEKTDIGRVFEEFRAAHGRELHAMGWARESVFFGMNPLEALTVDEVPGLMALLLAGGKVERILPDRILLKSSNRDRMAWLKKGCFVSDEYREHIEIMEKC